MSNTHGQGTVRSWCGLIPTPNMLSSGSQNPSLRAFFYDWQVPSAYLTEYACLSWSDNQVLLQMWQSGKEEHFVWRALDCDHGVIWSPGGNKDTITATIHIAITITTTIIRSHFGSNATA